MLICLFLIPFLNSGLFHCLKLTLIFAKSQVDATIKVVRKDRQTKSGFTIIEIVLVLAIAGLIFLMVFIALPALQRTQRNTDRRRDLSLIVTAMNTWHTHNSVSVTDNFTKRNATNGFCTFYKRYVTEDVVDPSTGEPFKVALWGSTFVVNCINNQVYNRGRYDPEVVGSQTGGVGSDNWAYMEVGDIQYDDGAYCSEEDNVFIDDIGGGRYAGYHIFAFRIRLEGGESLCLDNGYSFASLPYQYTIGQLGDVHSRI